MNNNFNQPYIPSGEIKFDQFNPVKRKKNNRGIRDKRAVNGPDHYVKLVSEHKRLSRRLREIESILNKNNKDGNLPKGTNPVRYGNEFRSYSYKNRHRNSKKAPLVNKSVVKDVEKDIVDTKKELGF